MKTLLHQVSWYPNYYEKESSETVNIFEWLKREPTAAHLEKLEAIRRGNKGKKNNLECITPSGICSPSRANEFHVSHSGLIFVDIDVYGEKNTHVTDRGALFSFLCSIPQVMYCSRSASGKGFHMLFPIRYPEKHAAHYKFVVRWFAGMGLEVDNCSDLARLKGYTHDPNAYFNPGAPLLENFDDIQPVTPAPKRDFKPYNGIAAANEPIWEWFNRTADVPAMLESYGYRYLHTKGERMRYERPGQDVKGRIGIDWHTGRRIIYFFTLSIGDLGGKGHTPFTVFARYQFNGDTSAAAKFLIGQVKGQRNMRKPASSAHAAPHPCAAPQSPPIRKPIHQTHSLEMAAITQEAISVPMPEASRVTWTTPAVNPDHFPAPADEEQAEDYGGEIEALRARFEGAPVPSGPVRLSPVETVMDIPAFIAGHLAMAQANQGTNVGRPYLGRLRKYFTFLNLSPQNITTCI